MQKSIRTTLVVAAALIALGAVTDSGPLMLGGGTAEAVIGRPLTPVSYAGVARRTTRRTVAASTAYAAPPVVSSAAVITTLPAGCVQGGGVYTCGAVRYSAAYSGSTVVYRQL
jgi:hypothetical protein